MKPVVKIIRAIVLIAFLILGQMVSQQMKITASQTYQIMPFWLVVPVIAILFGALLRSDIFFVRNKVLKIDWVSLLIIGIPTLMIAFILPIMSLFPDDAPLPQFFAFPWGDQIRLFSGIAFGYTVVNSLFAVKDCK